MEKNTHVRCFLVDFSKAFDTVPHRELLAKLVGYGCHQKIINWLANYLSDRKQSVTSLKGLSINQSIIQGSGIGPFCFLAHIADLQPKHTDTVYCKFADDLTALIREDSRATDEIKHILEWARINKLTINIKKNQGNCCQESTF